MELSGSGPGGGEDLLAGFPCPHVPAERGAVRPLPFITHSHFLQLLLSESKPQNEAAKLQIHDRFAEP